ncbi:hypothetical protein ARMSODRAFT_1018827 [Armillaria solidipes]|uniref:Uncharacterized protein n=1 Tax=Armillaria solidipes TaxID=1076256 RepID=A0A2H3BIB9_9AGAR|nr:hypothetical protein ARMSODRAFT_1018827 [Armillaria solidipes]
MPYLTFDEMLQMPSPTKKPRLSVGPPTPSEQEANTRANPAQSPQPSPSPTKALRHCDAEALSITHHVALNQTTTLDQLYQYPTSVTLQYPETTSGPESQIGHLFTIAKGSDLYNPLKDVAYSLGPPRGNRKPVYIYPLTGTDGRLIPCERIFATCQGVKICPYVDPQIAQRPHVKATSESLHQQLMQDRSLLAEPSPEQVYFQKTLSLWVAIHDGGCPYPAQEPTTYSAVENIANQTCDRTPTKARRGQPSRDQCQGRIVVQQSSQGYTYIACEHYNSRSSKKHFVNRTIANGPYNTEYLFALLNNDIQTVLYWEHYAKDHGYGPLQACTRVQNVTSIKVNCPHTHRDLKDHTMYMTEMMQLRCNAKFTAYIPYPEYRQECPHTLVVCHSSHHHPIPLPSTMPEPIRQSLKTMLLSLEQDLPDMTPRRLLRHPLFRSYLVAQLPHTPQPMATDLHPSLANLDHIDAIINNAISSQYTKGTGWEGIKYLFDLQNRTVPPHEHYIRHMEEVSWERLNDPSPGPLADHHDTFRLIICMSPSRSHDLLCAQYVESDISFKRVAGYKEFELVAFDTVAKTGVVYCRALLNCQSAIAHQRLFDKIREIVHSDTNSWLEYRHLHSPSLQHHRGILHWGVDQDGGQARGLGLHLQAIAQQEIPFSTKDLHEPHRYLHELNEYEHVHRLLHLCWVHVERNIKKAKVTDEVKTIMRSLMCITHTNFDSAIHRIQDLGQSAGTNWVQDKIRSKFAFEAMCWEKSKLPLDIWKAGNSHTNLAEGLHADVNREGIQCSLVGGIRRAQHFDMMRLKSQQVHQQVGIFARNRPMDTTTSARLSHKRKTLARSKTLDQADAEIMSQNTKLRDAHMKYQQATYNLAQAPHEPGRARKVATMKTAFDNALKKSIALANKHHGSGQINVWLP